MILGHTTGYMRVMVLDLHYRQRLLLRPTRGEVVGMQVASERLGGKFEDATHMRDGLLEKVMALEVLEIPDVLAEESLLVTGETNRVLQFAANCEDGWNFFVQENRHGDVPTGSAYLTHAAATRAYHGIIFANEDVAIVHEGKIGNALEPAHGLAIVDDDRFFAQVGTGHHERAEFSCVEQQVMNRRVGQKQAEVAIAGSDTLGDFVFLSAPG